MASTPYSVGTITVANGGTTVTGTETYFIGAANENDMLFIPAQGLMARITADADNDELLTITPWAGTDLIDAPYEIIPASDTTTSSARLRDLLAQMSVVEANGRGLFFRFSDSTADSDPGPGYLRFNNATFSSSTGGFLDNLDANGASVASEIDTWDDSTSIARGRLWVRSIADPSAFHAVKITGSVVDGTGYRKLTWTYVGGSGSFAADDELMAFFVPTGDRGDGYVYDAEGADSSDLAAFESEDLGYLVFLTDLGIDFGSYAGRSGVVRLIAGPDWELAAVYTGPEVSPRFDILLDDGGRPGSAEMLLAAKMSVNATFPENMAGSQVLVGVNPTAEAVYSFTKNAVEFATLTIATGGGTTFESDETTFAIGDVLRIIAPNPRDATLSGVSMTLAATR